jgi:hypothetical protein
MLDPLVRAGVKKINVEAWAKNQPVNEARYQHMVSWCESELKGIIDAVDDGAVGKPSGVGLFIDDLAIRLGSGAASFGWEQIARTWG